VALTTLLSLLAPPLCAACAAHAPADRVLCPACARELRWLGPEPLVRGALGIWAPLAYEGPAAAVARGLKYRGALRLASGMAAAVAANAPPGVLASGALVPVPLHPARRRHRGFNQAERLGRALAQRTGLGLSDCLERRGSRGTQVGRSRADRGAAIEGAVRVRTSAQAPSVAVLVDDVATTGATLEACARALLAEGAEEVRAVAYARTPGR
jgi:ComF family protein